MIALRILDRPLKERLLVMLPIIAAGITGFAPVPLTVFLADMPMQLADTSAPVGAAVVGFHFANDTRPDGARHVLLLALSLFAMTAACHLVYVLINFAIAPQGDAEGAAWLGLMILSVAAGIATAAGTWFLIARLTRGESLWDKTAEGSPEGAAG